MENKLWSDILAQSGNLSHVVRHLFTTERPRIDAAAEFLRGDSPIVLIGVASAEYLCRPTAIYLAQHGRFASTACASDALYSLLPSLRSSKVVINTRSGETAEIVKLASALVEHDIPFVVITNEPDSTAAKLARHVVWADTRKDDLVSINVVTGMMTATLALAAAVTGELDSLRPEFERLAASMPAVVARAEQQARALWSLFAGIRPVYLLYRGCSAGSAYNGRLVLEEVSRTPAVAIEAAAFRQGPNEVVDERFGTVLFVSEGKQGELNRSLASDILNTGGRVLLVGDVETFTANGAADRLVTFPIPSLPACLRPVLEVVPVQVLAFGLAQAQGYEPGQVRYISKVILAEEGIPNQNGA